MDYNSGTNCDDLYKLIGGAGITILFVLSEVLPFINSVKSNGLTHSFTLMIKKYYDNINESNETNENSHLVNDIENQIINNSDSFYY